MPKSSIPKTCSFDGCDRQAKAKSLCQSHYCQLHRGETLRPLQYRLPSGLTLGQVVNRIRSDRIEIDSVTGCWNYTAGLSASGYAYVQVAGRPIPMHRLFCEHYHGPAPEGTEACHSCDNPKCQNPGHLRWDTHSANLIDNSRTGPRHVSLKLSAEQIPDIRKRIESGERLDSIARDYGVTGGCIGKVKSRKNWAWVK